MRRLLFTIPFWFFIFDWNSLQDKQTVSWDNANDAVTRGYLASKTTLPTGAKQITKSEALNYLWVNPNFTTLRDKANNQLVTKSELVASSSSPLNSSSTVYFTGYPGHSASGWGTSADACSNYLSGITTSVYWNGPLTVGTKIYSDQYYGYAFMNRISPYDDWFYFNNIPVQLASAGTWPNETYVYVATVGACYTEVYITISSRYAGAAGSGSVDYTIEAWADAAHTTPINVDTTLSFTLVVTDDIYGNNPPVSVPFYSGTSYVTGTIGCVGGTFVMSADVGIQNISPNPSATQHYQ